MRNRFLSVALAGVSLLALAPFAMADAASKDLWYGIFFLRQPIGYAHLATNPDLWNGKKTNRSDSTTVTKIMVLGADVEQNVVTQTWSDAKSGVPLYQTFAISSGGSTTQITATFTPKYVDAVLTTGADKTTKRIPIPPGAHMAADDGSGGFDASKAVHVGSTEKELTFNPLTLTLDSVASTVTAKGIALKDALSGKNKETTRVTVASPQGDMTIYQDKNGDPVRITMPAGMMMLREPKQDALASAATYADLAVEPSQGAAKTAAAATNYTPDSDLAVATSVLPAGAAISDPRDCRFLKVRLTEPDKPSRVLTVQSVSVPPPSSDTVSEAAARPGLAPYLANAPYLSITDADIVAQAQTLRGQETNLYTIVERVHDWVHAQITPEGTLGLPRSATDVLRNPVGVCRDYATLYTSLARACGIPTRICAGLVAFRGRFYYHAWAESYIGGTTGWLPVDATMPGMFVDATHVPLAKGDPASMYELGNVIGSVKAQTLIAKDSL